MNSLEKLFAHLTLTDLCFSEVKVHSVKVQNVFIYFVN